MTETATTSIVRQTTTRLPKIAWAVVIAGVAVRLLLQVFKSDNLSTDPDAYVRLSQSLANGLGFSSFGATDPTAFRPPLFPFLLAIPQWLGLSTIVSIAVVQLASSALMIIATFKLAALMGLRQRGATLAACVVVCDPLLLFYSTLPMTEVMSAAFLTWAAVFILQIWQRLSADIFKGIFTCGILAGCCFGFGGLCRPILFVACALSSILLFVAAAFHCRTFYLRELKGRAERINAKEPSRSQPNASANAVTLGEDLEQMQGHRKQSRRTRDANRLAAASVPAIVAALILSPWVVRNAACFNQFIPATTHGGYTLLLGNNPVFYSEVVNKPGQPRWNGASLDRWNQQLSQEMAAAEIPPRDEVGRDRWMYARAKANINADPTSFQKACLLRLKRFSAVVPTAAAENGTTTKILVGLFYGLIAMGLLTQLLINMKPIFLSKAKSGRILQPWILWSLVVAFVMMHSVYWTNTRMRAPLMPVLIVLAVMSYSTVGHKLLNGWRRQADERPALPSSQASS